MPTLGDRKIKKIILPSSEPNDEAWVEVYDVILAEDMLDLTPASRDVKDISRDETTFQVLSKIIKDWNFNDKTTGKKAEITEETVRKIPMVDAIKIMEETKAMDKFSQLSNVKKNLSPSSLPRKKG